MTNFNTEQMLIMRYGFNPMIPLEIVAVDYLSGTTKTELRRNASNGDLPFPVIKNGNGKSTTYHVHVKALAEWIDRAAAEAASDHQAMHA